MAPSDQTCADIDSISPELCLVDPELAERARALLPVPFWLTLRSPGGTRPRRRPAPERRAAGLPELVPARPEPLSRPRRGSRAAAAVLLAVVGLVGSVLVVPRAGGGAHALRVAAPVPVAGDVAADPEPSQLTVPRVCGLAYVFAKGVLQEHGLGWQVSGPVNGYAGNRVSDQTPAPGTVVVDSGRPLVLLTLRRAPDYEPRGTPENTSQFGATETSVLAQPGNPLRLSKRVTACGNEAPTNRDARPT